MVKVIFFNVKKKIFKIAYNMNIFKVVWRALKFSFKSASENYASGNISFTQAALNNYFKAHNVNMQKKRCLSFFTDDVEKLRKVAVARVTPISLADTCMLAILHEFFNLDVDYLHPHNTSMIRNYVLIIITNYLFHNDLKLYKILEHFLTLKMEVI